MTNILRIITAQLNFKVGNIANNSTKIIAAIKQARDELHGDLIVFPELSVGGYPQEDLILRPDFQQQINQAVNTICEHAKGIDVVLGHVHAADKHIYNAVSVMRDQKILTRYYKQCLPNYGVFDEKRYFTAGATPCIFQLKNISIGVVICEDLWHSEPVAKAAAAGAQLILSPNASPFDMHKAIDRENVLRARIQENKIPIVYVNHIGTQDDLVFDGGSFAMNANGGIDAHAGFYTEKMLPIAIDCESLKISAASLPVPLSFAANIYQALVLSVRDYVNKNNFPGVLIGVSGGIDSALVLAIAVDALGKDRVHAVILPSRYTSELSMTLAESLIKNLGVKSNCISIEPAFNAFISGLTPELIASTRDITEQNIQSRCRAIVLMALSNTTGKMVLTTGNKSEMAVGYATIYGDMAGGYAVLKDVYKTLAYRLCDYRNQLSPVIPEEIIQRPPTAELAANQTDQDNLPPYAELDQILELFIEQDRSIAEIVAAGFAEETIRKVIKMVEHSEYKRRQSAPGPRVTTRAFTRERRYPIISGYKSN